MTATPQKLPNLPHARMAVAFRRAVIERDEDTAGAILDAIHGDKHATGAVLVSLVELSR